MTCPTNPAVTLQQATNLVISAANDLYEVINGLATEEVTLCDSQVIPTLRKALLDNFYFLPAIPYVAGVDATEYNQLYTYTDYLIYAPAATVSNPITAPANPLDSGDWQIFSGTGSSIEQQPRVVADGVTTVYDSPASSLQPARNFIVTLDGVKQDPVTDYDVLSNGDIEFTVAPEEDVAVDIIYFKNITIVDNQTGLYAQQAQDAADAAEISADEAEASALSAASNANFKGEWSSLTGALNIPATAKDGDGVYQLINNLTDVTLSQPSLNPSDWVLIYGTTKLRFLSGSGVYSNFSDISANTDLKGDTVDATTIDAMIASGATVRTEMYSSASEKGSATYTFYANEAAVLADGFTVEMDGIAYTEIGSTGRYAALSKTNKFVTPSMVGDDADIAYDLAKLFKVELKEDYTRIQSGGVYRSDGTKVIKFSGLSGTFTVSETITGGTSGATANVTEVGADYLRVDTVVGEFIAPYIGSASDEVITGGTSGATATTTEVKHWLAISDSEHIEYFFNDIDTNITEQYAVTIHRTKSAATRIAASVTADETLSLVGVQAGPSVNDDNVRLKMAAPLTCRFGVSSSPAFNAISSFHSSPTTIIWDDANDFFELDHLDCGLSGQAVVSYDFGAYTAVEEPFLPGVYRVNNTRHRIAQYMEMAITCEYNGSTWDITNREIGRNGDDETGYTVGFASQTFTITHPTIATREYDDNISIEFFGGSGNVEFYIAKVLKTATRTKIQFQVYDVLGAAILNAVPSGFKFTIKRDTYRVPRPLGGHVSLSLPYTRIDPKDVTSANGNIWVMDDERYSGL